MRIKIIAFSLALVGCQHLPAPVFVGGPLDKVVSQMGYPQTQRDFAGDTVYTWTESYVKTRWIFFQSRLTCQMDVGTKDGKVKSINYEGDGGPCSDLEGKLEAR